MVLVNRGTRLTKYHQSTNVVRQAVKLKFPRIFTLSISINRDQRPPLRGFNCYWDAQVIYERLENSITTCRLIG